MYSAGSTRALPRVGFPIRKSRDQRLVSISPGLIAAAHVLHRLLVPRHPPCALILLIRKNTLCCRYGVFKVPAGLRQRPTASAQHREPHAASEGRQSSVSQNSTACDLQTSRSTFILGVLCHRTSKLIDGHTFAERVRAHEHSAYRSKSSGIPRKEVIQPQLPLRLPCYDFTPITSPTFDGSLPCGLGHRLRVLPAFVV